MPDDVLERVRALERAVTDRDDPPAPLPEHADLATALEQLDDRVTRIESNLADVSARQTAVEAYLDQVEHVNESVERRADAALAAVDRLESTDSPAPPPETNPVQQGELADHSGNERNRPRTESGRRAPQSSGEDFNDGPAAGAHIADAAGLDGAHGARPDAGGRDRDHDVADIDTQSESRRSLGLFGRIVAVLLGR